ncbi:MAG: undecaprenyl-phosphate glucose phosphotransferase [Ruminococcaceae bacterium]|nr:undecaprenyl-phosphate glucose phosphotransferase [Oscillospiraceae bacterium]
MVKENQHSFVTLLKCADVIIGLISIITAFGIRFYVFRGFWEVFGLDYYMRMMVLILPVYFLIYSVFELYDLLSYKPLLAETEKVISANLVGLVFIFVLSFFLRVVDLSRMVILLFALINTVLSAALRIFIRLFLRSLRQKGYTLKRLLIVGWNHASGELFDKMMANRNYGYDVIGYLSNLKSPEEKRKINYIGQISMLESFLKTCRVDEVVISLDYSDLPLLGEIIEVCEREGVKSSLLPFYSKYMPAHPHVDEIDGIPLVNVRRIPLDNLMNSLMKRSLDIFGSLFLLIVLSPLMLLTAVCIRISSPGPVIYCQQRIGRNRKEFTMYKFRSMQAQNQGDMTTWGCRGDCRRTGFGAFIRKYSIDELPQLVNVLKGEMSLVGPRPERPFFVEKFRDEVPLYMLKHLVRPGITGWAQVNGWRGDTSIVERVKCDLFYIENWSFMLDIKILLMTLVKGFVNESEEL